MRLIQQGPAMRPFVCLAFCCLLSAIASAAEPLRILTWNIDGENSDMEEIMRQLRALRAEYRFDVLAISEVPATETKRFVNFFAEGAGVSGKRGEAYRLVTAWEPGRLSLISGVEVLELDGFTCHSQSVAPLAARLRDHLEVREVYVVNYRFMHDALSLSLQAGDLARWATAQVLPVFFLGDFDPDYSFGARKDLSKNYMLEDLELLTWVKPEPLVDSQWVDADADNVDDNPESLSDFVFYNGMNNLRISAEVIVREGDYPDDDKTSDHRPVLVTIE